MGSDPIRKQRAHVLALLPQQCKERERPLIVHLDGNLHRYLKPLDRPARKTDIVCMNYNDFTIQLARKRGAPDPEGNARRGNEILALMRRHRFDEARARLDSITDPLIRQSLSEAIAFDTGALCMPRR